MAVYIVIITPLDLECTKDLTYLHQVIILKDGRIPSSLPHALEKNSECARTYYPEAEYLLWSGEALRDFIAQEFDRDVVWAYDTLTPYSYKCDLARFCLLYAKGGLYVDLGVRLLSRWDIPDDFSIAACRDVPLQTPSWTCIQTGLLWSQPKQAEFATAIRFIVENCRTRYYGQGPLHPTGPVLLGRAMIATLLDPTAEAVKRQWIGVCRPITPEHRMLNLAYLSRTQKLIAMRTKVIPGDLSHLGVRNGNNYNSIWKSRTVYGEYRPFWRAFI